MTDSFATIAQLAAYLQQDIADDDLFAQLALDGATQAIRLYCDQRISYVHDEVALLDGTGTDIILLPELPVVDVTSVETDADGDSPRTLLDQSHGTNAEYDVDLESGLLIRRHGVFQGMSGLVFGSWPLHRRSVRVTYSHGFRDANELHSAEVSGVAATISILVPGIADGDTLVTVVNLTDNAVSSTFTLNADHDGIVSPSANTTSKTLLVTWETPASNFPADIMMITVVVAARSLTQDGATNESVGAYSAAYEGQPATLTKNEMVILDSYRRRRK